MKFVLVALLIAAQFASDAYGQDKPKSNDSRASTTAQKSTELPEPVDFDYAWDEFNHRGRMIWACRGVQSGAFVPPELCAFKPKIDSQWPDKKIPHNWKE
jgi:hypothetical protein